MINPDIINDIYENRIGNYCYCCNASNTQRACVCLASNYALLWPTIVKILVNEYNETLINFSILTPTQKKFYKYLKKLLLKL